MTKKQKRALRKKGIHVKSESAVARVRCNGSYHSVVWNAETGTLQLPNHPDIKKEKILGAFGTACRCLQVREQWRNGEIYAIPTPLREALYAILKIARLRKKRSIKESGKQWPYTHFQKFLTYPVVLSMPKFVEQCASKILCALTYLKVKTQLVEKRSICSVWVKFGTPGGGLVNYFAGRSYPTSLCSKQRQLIPVKKMGSNDKSTLTISIPVNWYSSVYERGLTVVDNRLILVAHKPEDEEKYTQATYWRLQKRPQQKPVLSVSGEFLVETNTFQKSACLLNHKENNPFVKVGPEFSDYGFFGLAMRFQDCSIEEEQFSTTNWVYSVDPVLITHDHKRVFNLNTFCCSEADSRSRIRSRHICNGSKLALADDPLWRELFEISNKHLPRYARP